MPKKFSRTFFAAELLAKRSMEINLFLQILSYYNCKNVVSAGKWGLFVYGMFRCSARDHWLVKFRVAKKFRHKKIQNFSAKFRPKIGRINSFANLSTYSSDYISQSMLNFTLFLRHGKGLNLINEVFFRIFLRLRIYLQKQFQNQ